jgi:hypothetical protein
MGDSMKQCFLWSATFLAALAVGCSDGKPYDVVEVEGQVLLDGQPTPNARIVFRPVAAPNQKEVGPDAYATTDAEGRFSLTTVFDEQGAAVGRNLVSISTYQVQENPADPDNARARQVITPEKIPPRYNANTELFFDVQEGAKAVFNLQSR